MTRESSIDETGTLTVTTTINPKEIDHGAEVIVLLDTSRKMVQADGGEAFKKAKEKIKELVTTLVGEKVPHSQRNSVRMITFYKKLSDVRRLNEGNVNQKLEDIHTSATESDQYGVALQEAIHRARSIFESEREKNKNIKYNKRQHIVLFSQGEATFSYDLADKDNAKKQNIAEKEVTYSYPMWPFYFDTKVAKGNLLDDAESALGFLSANGVDVKEVKKHLKSAEYANSALDFLGLIGFGNPLDYRTLEEFKYSKNSDKQFNYTNKIGEGYNYRSFSRIDRSKSAPVLSFLKKTIKDAASNDTKVLKNLQYYFPFVKTATDATIDAILDRLFYPKSYVFHNHNLAAKAEVKLAQNADIKFYSVDVTKDTNFNKFDDYLKSMSEDGKILDISNNKSDLATKFKDTLKNITITDKLDNVLISTFNTNNSNLIHTPVKSWFGVTTDTLIWTIDETAIKEAFEEGKPLTATYTIKVKTPSKPGRTETAISPELKYTINDKIGKASSILQPITFKQVESKVDKIVETHSEGIVELDSKLAPISGSNSSSIDEQVEIIDDTTTPKKTESEVKPEADKQPKVESKPETKAAATKQSSASRVNQSSANQTLPSTGDKESVLATLLGIELMFTAGLCARRKED